MRGLTDVCANGCPIQIHPYKTAEQHAVVHPFYQQPLTSDRVQHLQQLRHAAISLAQSMADHFAVNLVELR